jgi:hypothetical protein
VVADCSATTSSITFHAFCLLYQISFLDSCINFNHLTIRYRYSSSDLARGQDYRKIENPHNATPHCEEATEISIFVQDFIEQGAMIVGKAKTTQLVSGPGSRDWIENQCPFNPGGDGNLDSDFSTGSTVATASYDWLHYTIGSGSKSNSHYGYDRCEN